MIATAPKAHAIEAETPTRKYRTILLFGAPGSGKGTIGKALGAHHLHRFTAELPLDFFVLFSSYSATLGAPGQSAYTAANAVLDSLAGHRRALGLPATSIGWGPWQGVGMAGPAGGGQLRWEERGLHPAPAASPATPASPAPPVEERGVRRRAADPGQDLTRPRT